MAAVLIGAVVLLDLFVWSDYEIAFTVTQTQTAVAGAGFYLADDALQAWEVAQLDCGSGWDVLWSAFPPCVDEHRTPVLVRLGFGLVIVVGLVLGSLSLRETTTPEPL